MKVQTIFTAPVRSMESDETLTDAAERMVFHHVGALPVFHLGKLAGIVTERDIVRAVADDVTLASTSIQDYMTEGPLAVTPSHDIAEAAAIMSDYGLRHLPVVEHGHVIGMLSIRDLVEARS